MAVKSQKGTLDVYFRDKSVFSEEISIEDSMGVMVRYKNNAILTYSLNSYLPLEAFRVAFNRSKGRMEVEVYENAYTNGGGKIEGSTEFKKIIVHPMFGSSYEVEVCRRRPWRW